MWLESPSEMVCARSALFITLRLLLCRADQGQQRKGRARAATRGAAGAQSP
jgi:hypothetical protein